MAIVGDAEIIVRAITTNVEKDIRNGFRGMDKVGATAGRNVAKSFNQELSKLGDGTALDRFGKKLESLAPGAKSVASVFNSLVRAGFFLQSGLGAIAGSLGAVVGGLGALIGVAGGATPAIAALGGAFGSLIVGMQVAKGAFKGIGSALSQLQRGGGGGGGGTNQRNIEDAMKSLALAVEASQKRIVAANNRIRVAQLNLNAAFKEGREEIQQLGFDAESAALSEKKAALDLEKARDELARAQDLPPNSRVRREAELAFQEAELNYRQSKDRNSDIAAEQERLARSGVEGTSAVIQARQELAEAEENLRDTVVDSLRAQEDAQKRLNDAINNTGGGGGGADPLKGLTDSQKVFVNYLYKDVLPALFTLKVAASDSFLPVLQEQMQRMFGGGLFERLRAGIEGVSKGLAVAVTNFTDVLMQESVMEDFSNFFKNSADILPKFGTIFGNVFGSILSILDAVSPVTKNFVGFLESKAMAFKNFLDIKSADGTLTGFFARAGELAGRFGDVFGNIFGGIGKMIQSNIGPGTGGDMLLTWLQTATQGFANMDTTTLTTFFKSSAANLISMLDTLGNFFSAIIAAGANPAVGQVWEIFQSGIGVFRRVVMESVKAAPSLANVLVKLGEIIAVFADAASIESFMNTLSIGISAFQNIVRSAQPFLNIVGPWIAAISAVAVSIKLLNKGWLIAAGNIQIGIDGVKKLISRLLIWDATNKGLAASERTLNIARLQTVATEKAAELAAATRQVQALANIGTTQAQVAAEASRTIALQASTVASTQLAIASGAAGAAIWAALAPLLPVILAVGAAVAVVFAYNAIQQQNLDKAVNALKVGFEEGATAAEQFQNSLLAVGDGKVKKALADPAGGFKNMHDSIKDLDVVQDNFFVGFFGFFGKFVGNDTLQRTTAMADSFGAIGKQLSNMAADDLPGAQAAFKNYAAGMNMTHDEVRIGLDEMDEYKSALMEQAATLGISLVDAQTGAIDQQKLVNFALGEGEVAVRRYVSELAQQAQATHDAAIAAISASDAYKVATTNLEGETVPFDLSAYLTNMQTQIDAANAYVANMQEATQLGLSAASTAFLNNQGAEGQVILQSIIDGGEEAVGRFNATMGAMSAETSRVTLLNSSAFQTAIANISATGAEDTAKAIADGVALGTISAEDAIKTLGITVEGFDTQVILNANGDTAEAAIEAVGGDLEGIKTAAKNGPSIDVKNKEALSKVQTVQDSIDSLTDKTVTLTVKTKEMKDGGFVWPWNQKNGGIMKAANGGVARFATGMLRGAGGPRDDRIPAMLSAGEYVVNAMATKKYLPLLQQINNGSPTFEQGQGQSGGGANIQITVNPSAGMDERALAFAVSRELAFQMRKGSM
jgi:hypothetical protein